MAVRGAIDAGAMTELRGALGGEVVGPDDAGYEQARSVWNGTIDRRPAAVARCRDAADVAAALGFAAGRGLDVAVRGGGHSFPGFSTCDGGIVVDLSPMKRIEVDAGARRVTAEGGVVWAELDRANEEHGLALPGGAISHTGIAGLTLGGGIGWLSRKHGLTCDNLISAEVVTADGRTVTASDTEHPDLFWALHGGGGNFGVVTRFQFRVHPLPALTLGLFFLPAEAGAELLAAYRDWARQIPDETGAIFFNLNIPPAPFVPPELHFKPTWALVTASQMDQPAAEAVLAPMRSVATPLFEMVTPMPYSAMQGSFDEGVPHGSLFYQKAVFLAELGDGAIEALVAAAAAKGSPMSQLHVWTLGGAIARVGEDETPFRHRSAFHQVDVLGHAMEPGQVDAERAWARQTFAALDPFSVGAYVNFMSEEDTARTRREAYGERTYDRLARIKRDWDPGNLFHLNQNIEPAPQ